MGANAHHSIFDYGRALSQDEIFVLVGGCFASNFPSYHWHRYRHGWGASETRLDLK
jgi:hypothetical protein